MKKNREEVEKEINIRAWKDPSFKKKLHEHPKEALKEFGIKEIPESIKIHVVEESSNTWCIVIRKAPPNAHQMSDSELRKILAAAASPMIGYCP